MNIGLTPPRQNCDALNRDGFAGRGFDPVTQVGAPQIIVPHLGDHHYFGHRIEKLRIDAVLWLRSLLWTILLPGVVAGYVPWAVFGLDRVRWEWNAGFLAGVLIVAAGAALLAACVVEFARSGRGTLSPVDPPRHLVVRGLYRYVRNPMYLSVTAISSARCC